MKRFLTIALAFASAGLIVNTASAIDTYIPGDPANGIGDSRHNLGSAGKHITTQGAADPQLQVSVPNYGLTEICVFCHTPHHTNTTEYMLPLWNRGTSAPSAFTAYGTTIGGTTITSADIGGTTLACLSCHDGVTTFDNIVNAPGKNPQIVPGGADRGWSFVEDSVAVSDFITSSRLNIGLNLSNDHPVSVAYNASVAGLRPTNTTISGIDLTADLAGSAAAFDNGNLLKNLWAVKGYVSNTATIADLLRDYNGTPRVECSSCHDPHFNNKSWNEIDATYAPAPNLEIESNGLFLRRVGGNSGSGLCRTCHNK